MTKFLKVSLFSVSVAIALSACSGDGSKYQDSSDNSSVEQQNGNTTNEQSNNSKLIEGQLIDGYIAGAHYRCADGSEGDTDLNGTFKCSKLPVEFTISNVKLGDIKKLPEDKHIFPQDLVGVDRNSTDDKKVLALAKFLQSLDDNGDLDDGIQISNDVKEAIKEALNKKEIDLTKEIKEENDTLVVDKTLKEVESKLKEKYNKDIHIVDEKEAKEHIEKIKHIHEEVQKLPNELKKDMQTPAKKISDDLKEALAKVKVDSLNSQELYKTLSQTISEDNNIFEDIAKDNSRFKFNPIDIISQKYSISQEDINKLIDETKEDLEVNKAKAENNITEALKVGCIVESKNMDDIEEAYTLSKKFEVGDIQKTLKYQNKESYERYKEFNNKLIEYGVDNGCCSLGDEYCKIDNKKEGMNKEHNSSKDTQDKIKDKRDEFKKKFEDRFKDKKEDMNKEHNKSKEEAQDKEEEQKESMKDKFKNKEDELNKDKKDKEDKAQDKEEKRDEFKKKFEDRFKDKKEEMNEEQNKDNKSKEEAQDKEDELNKDKKDKEDKAQEKEEDKKEDMNEEQNKDNKSKEEAQDKEDELNKDKKDKELL